MCCFTYSRAYKKSWSSNSYWLKSKSFMPLMGQLFYTYPLQVKAGTGNIVHALRTLGYISIGLSHHVDA